MYSSFIRLLATIFLFLSISIDISANEAKGIDSKSFQYNNRRLALVIGNWEYKIGPLQNPKADSEEIAKTLKKLGFDVIYKKNVNRSAFRKAIRDFGNQLYNYNVGLFFYAGHGIQVHGTNYLIPVDSDITVEDEVHDEGVQAGLVLRKMQSAGNFLNIVILDACRNNPFARSFRTSIKGLARMDAPKGTLISYSTAPGSTASDGSGKHSPFAKHLLMNLTTQGIPIEEVFKRVRIGVDLETQGQQTSWESSSLMGEFYFAEIEDNKQLTGMLEVNVDNIDGELFVDDTKVTVPQNDKIAFVALIPGWHFIAIKQNNEIKQTKRVFISAGNVTYVNQIVEKTKEKLVRQSAPIRRKRISLPPP